MNYHMYLLYFYESNTNIKWANWLEDSLEFRPPPNVFAEDQYLNSKYIVSNTSSDLCLPTSNWICHLDLIDHVAGLMRLIIFIKNLYAQNSMFGILLLCKRWSNSDLTLFYRLRTDCLNDIYISHAYEKWKFLSDFSFPKKKKCYWLMFHWDWFIFYRIAMTNDSYN